DIIDVNDYIEIDDSLQIQDINITNEDIINSIKKIKTELVIKNINNVLKFVEQESKLKLDNNQIELLHIIQ
ncbi:5307_t:CDS:1, partial [Diversispora eburnea]